MKLNKKSLREITSKLLKSYIFEAEEKAEENPFAAAEEGGEEEEAPADDAKADDEEKAPAKAEEPKVFQ